MSLKSLFDEIEQLCDDHYAQCQDPGSEPPTTPIIEKLARLKSAILSTRVRSNRRRRELCECLDDRIHLGVNRDTILDALREVRRVAGTRWGIPTRQPTRHKRRVPKNGETVGMPY